MGDVELKGEKALVILLGRFEFDEIVKIRIFHIIKNGVDWYDFLNYSVRTNTVCLVYANMVKLGIEKLLPATIKSNMKYHYIQNTVRNQHLLVSLEKIIQGLAEKDITVVPIKGAKFLYTIYKDDLGVRLLNDIDLLAEHSSKDAIYEYMKENGFCSYLVNNKDAFCSNGADEECHFYISITKVGLHDDLRIDFDYTYPAIFIKGIKENNHLYEFCYLCKLYYSSMKKEAFPYTVDQFNYIKLVDIYEYHKSYLSNLTWVELKSVAKELNFVKELNYVLACFEQLGLQIRIA